MDTLVNKTKQLEKEKTLCPLVVGRLSWKCSVFQRVFWKAGYTLCLPLVEHVWHHIDCVCCACSGSRTQGSTFTWQPHTSCQPWQPHMSSKKCENNNKNMPTCGGEAEREFRCERTCEAAKLQEQLLRTLRAAVTQGSGRHRKTSARLRFGHARISGLLQPLCNLKY